MIYATASNRNVSAYHTISRRERIAPFYFSLKSRLILGTFLDILGFTSLMSASSMSR
jgi:hypothetical protein